MDDNRFTCTYLENKREREIGRSVVPDYNNRFQCLKSDNSEPVRNAGRFECLRSDNYVSYHNSQDSKVNTSENNRFSCLVDDGYQRYPRADYAPRSEYKSQINHLPRQAPLEEPKIIVNRSPSPPPMTFESEYHFPELGRAPKIQSNSQLPKVAVEIKTPELKPQREMIFKPGVIPRKKETITLMSFKEGKLVKREVYEDGNGIPESGIMMVKKSNYSSWASLLKPEKTELVYYDAEDDSVIEMSGV
jgi:hypothetical protein